MNESNPSTTLLRVPQQPVGATAADPDILRWLVQRIIEYGVVGNYLDPVPTPFELILEV